MKRFEVLNSRNSQTNDESLSAEAPNQLWGVVMSELTEYGSQWSFGVALNESLLTTVVIPNDHGYLEQLKLHSEQFIGEFYGISPA